MRSADHSNSKPVVNGQYTASCSRDGRGDSDPSTQASEPVMGGLSRWPLTIFMAIVAALALVAASCSGASTVSP